MNALMEPGPNGIRPDQVKNMRMWIARIVLAIMLAMPAAAWAQTLDEAAAQAARAHNAKVLSARTVQEGNKRVHVIKLLTPDGVVMTVRIPVRDN